MTKRKLLRSSQNATRRVLVIMTFVLSTSSSLLGQDSIKSQVASSTQIDVGWKAWLGLTVVAAIVSTVGALFGIFLKDYLFSRSLEQWKQRQTLEQLYQKYR